MPDSSKQSLLRGLDFLINDSFDKNKFDQMIMKKSLPEEQSGDSWTRL